MIYMCYEYPVWNDYWDFIRPKLEKINCPLYIVAGWTNPLHVNGTFRAWETISSNEKWLRVHNTHEWPDLYDPANVEDLRKFYNYYLKDVQNDWVFTPRVRLSVLNAGGSDIVNRPEKTFPLKRQQEYKIYLNPETMELSPSRPEETMTFSHDAITGSSTFIFPFSYTTEFVGHSKLRLWGSTTSSNDMDIFVHLQKFDAVSGLVLESVVTNVGRLMDNPAAARKELLTGRAADPSFCNEYFYSGPRGRLRASHRALDLQKSTSLHPVYTHTEEQLLSPGEVVCLDIDIWPYGWVFEKGQELRLTISGFNTKPHLGKVDKQPRLRNQGAHVFYGGGRYDSFLLLPLIPQAEQFSV
jgi:predicted acyl esterase